jgi:succinate-acetate transporter protein
MLSVVNANLVDPSVKEYVYAVALIYGGITQFVAGLIQLRLGNTFTGVLFCSFGAFWASLFVIVEFFQPSVPPAHQGQALGLFLSAFAVFAGYILLAALRTNVVTIAALVALIVTLVLLAVGNFSATNWLIRSGGYTGIALAALAIYLSASGVCQATYGRDVLPVGDLARQYT